MLKGYLESTRRCFDFVVANPRSAKARFHSRTKQSISIWSAYVQVVIPNRPIEGTHIPTPAEAILCASNTNPKYKLDEQWTRRIPQKCIDAQHRIRITTSMELFGAFWGRRMYATYPSIWQRCGEYAKFTESLSSQSNPRSILSRVDTFIVYSATFGSNLKVLLPSHSEFV